MRSAEAREDGRDEGREDGWMDEDDMGMGVVWEGTGEGQAEGVGDRGVSSRTVGHGRQACSHQSPLTCLQTGLSCLKSTVDMRL